MTKKQFKKYKFDANMPFDIKNTVEFINVSSIKNNVLNFQNSFLSNVQIVNVSVNRIFIDKITFENNFPDNLKVQDLSMVIPNQLGKRREATKETN